MPITGIIPGFSPQEDQISKLIDDMNKRHEFIPRQRLMEAQAQEAQGNAYKSKMLAKLLNDFLGNSQEQNNGQPISQPNQPNQPIPYNNTQNDLNYNPPRKPINNISGMSRHDIIARANADQAKYDRNHQQKYGMDANAVNAQQNSSESPNTQPKPINMQQNPLSEEKVIKSGNPNKYKYDSMAGTNFAGISIPAVRTRVVDGVEYNTYPSGKETATKVGPTWAEKQQQAVDLYGERKQKEIDIKDSSDIVKSARYYKQAADLVKNLHTILTKPENKNLTGSSYAIPFIGKTLAKNAGKDLGSFDADSAALQSLYAKLETSRPGIGMVNFYKETKPDRENNVDRNIGMLESNARKLLNLYEDDKAQWEAKNPDKTFPYERPDFSGIIEGEQTKVINGKTYKMINHKWHEKE